MYASLCILAYKRPEWLSECLDSILKTVDYPCEIIVNCDGGDRECYNVAHQYLLDNKISKLVVSNGNNRGVGRSLSNCIGVSEGDFIFKIDTDLIFRDGWLSYAVEQIVNGYTISLFNYRNYDPLDTRFQILDTVEKVLLVNDFVSSVYGFKREALSVCPFDGNDDGYHQLLGTKYPLAISPVDYVYNRGFGIGKSVYLSGTMDKPYKTPTYSSPLIFPKMA
jgi:glycosyltransferase involved in cell wall biosynthesis